MTLRFFKPFASVLMSATLLWLATPAQATVVSTEQAAAQAGNPERDRVAGLLERQEVAAQLQALGLDADAARQRLAALSDAEVHSLAGRIDQLPAGGAFASFSDQQLIIILLTLILLAILL